MKFDYIIGNPPYQEETESGVNRQEPVYNFFMDSVYEISDKVLLITPARFLFNAGQTPKAWNKKMLDDPHLSVVFYQIDSKTVFAGVDIKGGVSVTYRDARRQFGPIKNFVPYDALRSAMYKVRSLSTNYLDKLVCGQSNFDLDALYEDYPDLSNRIHSNGRSKQIRSNAFEVFPELFYETEDIDHNLGMYGLFQHKRCYRYVLRRYVEQSAVLDAYKVMIPQANGSGAIGEVLSTPVIGTPLIGTPVIGYTQSFISIGPFDTLQEAENCLKYVKSKFLRAMLGTLKITQNNAAPEIWSNIPLQDFTSNSDIDWSASITNIDRQLYRKYGLTQEEIDFIETHVKAME